MRPRIDISMPMPARPKLNGGSAVDIPDSVRRVANREFEGFVQHHIEHQVTFAIETTLRSNVTFRQAGEAHKAGFETAMHYLVLNSVTDNLDRVRIRADAGGHSAPESKFREIHRSSLRNLPGALEKFDRVRVYDNSRFKKNRNFYLKANMAALRTLPHARRNGLNRP